MEDDDAHLHHIINYNCYVPTAPSKCVICENVNARKET